LLHVEEDAVSHEIAGTYGLAAMDALHVAAALQIQADELITTEKQTKPMHRVREIQIVSI
jgi:predicted nucleic acid-binding protein